MTGWQKVEQGSGGWVKTKTAHVTMVVDRSGSMSTMRHAVIEGLNAFLHEQQGQLGECLVTMHQFDTGGFDTLFSAMEVKQVRDATLMDFVPRGGTPLYDAIGRAIMHAQVRAEYHKDEQPIIVVMTDGEENSSKEYSREKVFDLIKQKEAQGWVFTYLGANQDSFAVGGAVGFHRASIQNWDNASMAYSAVSNAVTSTRTRLAEGQTVSSRNFYSPNDTNVAPNTTINVDDVFATEDTQS